MTTDVSFPVSSDGWICSGQDATIRRALLQAAWRRILPGACCVVVAAAECLPEVQALAAKSGTALHFFPAADQAYFPVFSPPDNQQRICRLVELMRLWGWDELLLGKVYAYLDLLLELDSWRQGRLAQLDLGLIGRYRGILAVERTLDRIPYLSRDQRRRLLEAYAECAAVGPALENFLRMLQPVCGLGQPSCGCAARLPAGAVAVFPVRTMLEEKHRQCLLRLLAFDLADVERPISLTILEGTQNWGPELPLLLHQAHELGAFITLYSDDLFSGHTEEWLAQVEAVFSEEIFTRHRLMSSCRAVSEQCGQIEIVHPVRGYDRDRRLRSATLLERFFGLDRVDHYSQPAPVQEPLFRPEEIQSMAPGQLILKTASDTIWTTAVCLLPDARS